MLGNKKSPNKGTLNNELMQRLDNMEDQKDYNPYQAIKRTTIETKELFNDNNYDNDEENEDEDKLPIFEIIIVGIISSGILGAILFFILK